MRHILLFLIYIYQNMISPFFPSQCRFYPTCSSYAKEAILKYGSIRGTALFFKRIAKCHPFHPGGYDPVP